jgi:hypothetical protein
MSTEKVSFNELPTAGEVKNGDFFVIEDVYTAKKINFKNIIFGLDNVTFDIASLSSSIDSLSGQYVDGTSVLQNLITTTVTSATANFIKSFYPIGSILYTASNVNPSTYLVGTVWDQIAQGLFIAGVGVGTDKNGVSIAVGEANSLINFNLGEYNHTLTVTEMPAHNHTFSPIGETNASVAGSYVESAPGPGGALSPITSNSTGSGLSHNNVPPFYGLYVWKRVG